MTEAITAEALTIRQLKTLAKSVGVRGWSKLTKEELLAAAAARAGDEKALQQAVDAMLASESARVEGGGQSNGNGHATSEISSAEELEAARLDALLTIAKASGKRMLSEDALRSRRKELNQETSEAKASHKGAMEASVDYDKPAEVRAKLISVTEAWTGWQEALEHRRQELVPLKEALSAARKAERLAFAESMQMKLKF